MKLMVEELKKRFKVYTGKGVSSETISDAEKKLNLSFPEEYKEYLKTFGVLSFGSHEITGLGVDGYLNVVAATEKERNLGGGFPDDCFLLENNGIDGLLTVQDTKGIVYSLEHGKKVQIASSLAEYMKKLNM